MRLVLKLFLTLVGALCALMLVVAVVLILSPGLLINERSVTYTLATLLGEDSFQVKSSQISVESESWRKKLIRVYFEDLKITRPGLNVQTENLWVQVGIDLIGQPVFIYQIGPASLVRGRVTSHPTTKEHAPWDTNEEQETSLAEGFDQARNFLKYTKFETIKVRELVYQRQDEQGERQEARIALDSVYSDEAGLRVNGTVTAEKGWPFQSAQMTAAIVNWDHATELPVGSLQVTVTGVRGESAEVSTTIQPQGTGVAIDLDATAAGNGYDGSLRLNAFLNAAGFEGIVRGRGPSGTPALDGISVPPCKFSGVFGNNNDPIEGLRLTECKIVLKRRLLEIEQNGTIKLPNQIELLVSADAAWKQQGPAGDLTIDLIPVETDLYKLTSTSKINITNNAANQSLPVVVWDTDTRIAMNNFQSAVQRFNKADIVVPAPFNSLSGRMACDIKGRVELEQGRVRVPHNCHTRLEGEQQKIFIDESGSFDVHIADEGVSLAVSSEIQLNDIEVWLPDFSILEGLPSIAPESRLNESPLRQTKSIVQSPPAGEATSTAVAYDIKVATAKNPVLIHVPHYRTAIPISVQMNLRNDQPALGTVAVLPFELKVVKRPINIERVNVEFQSTGEAQIDALAKVDQTDYDVLINVAGNINEPRISVTSDPPQADEDVVSSLLYGQEPGQLGGAKQQSVAETQAALADGAIGLLSFFYLAATPVERVGYNPQTGNLRANVRIREGTSFVVGSDFEQQSQAGIRRRLFGNWSLETVAVRDSETGVSKGVAMLRWAKRY